MAQLGSAAALGAEGCGFKSCRPDSIYPCDVIGKHRLLKISVLQVRCLSGVLGIKPKSANCGNLSTQIVTSQLSLDLKVSQFVIDKLSDYF